MMATLRMRRLMSDLGGRAFWCEAAPRQWAERSTGSGSSRIGSSRPRPSQHGRPRDRPVTVAARRRSDPRVPTDTAKSSERGEKILTRSVVDPGRVKRLRVPPTRASDEARPVRVPGRPWSSRCDDDGRVERTSKRRERAGDRRVRPPVSHFFARPGLALYRDVDRASRPKRGRGAAELPGESTSRESPCRGRRATASRIAAVLDALYPSPRCPSTTVTPSRCSSPCSSPRRRPTSA